METLIIGGGVIGLSIARELKRRGVDMVTVLERGRVGRAASWAAAGLNVERLDRSEVKALEPDASDSVIGGLYFQDDGQVENRKLVEALAASATRLGVDIREGVDVKSVLSDQSKIVGVETMQGI